MSSERLIVNICGSKSSFFSLPLYLSPHAVILKKLWCTLKVNLKKPFHFLQEPPGIKDSDDDIEGYGTILIVLNINNIFLNMKWLLHLH